jgi:PKD repeat protein
MDRGAGDFRLDTGSPAIDSADSGTLGQTTLDAYGRPRVDVPFVANTGVGPRAYDDRGALEQPLRNLAPSAALAVSPSSGLVDLTVTADASASRDDDSVEPIATYRFDFGDGSAAVGPQPDALAAHTYRAAGTYTVTVTVTDAGGLSDTASQTVTVTDDPPTPSLTVTPNTGIAPLPVTADASGSTDTDGTPIASYRFDFGDGSPVVGPQSEPTATHVYATGGTHTVTVTVTDTAGLAAQTTAKVSVSVGTLSPPRAALTVTPDSGAIDLEVTADASASTDDDGTSPIQSYAFDFGDGSAIVGPQAGATAAHVYTSPGTYTVTVTVTDTAGLSDTETREVTVRDDPPDAALTVTPSTGMVPLQVTADASASRDADATPIDSYRFDFGDGSPVVGPQAEPTATHTYDVPGTYTVTVTVRDTAGLTGTASTQVVVRGNAVGNPGFEVDLSGWNTTGSGAGVALERITGGHGGDFAAQLSNTGTTAATCTLNDGPDWARPTEAGTYTGGLWVRADSPGATLKLRFREWIGPALVGTSVNEIRLTTSWQEISTSHVIQSPGSTLDLNAYVTNAAPGTCFSADDALIVLATAADRPPEARLRVTPSSGDVPLPVQADASESVDTDGTSPIASYRFDFGDGSAIVGPQADATAAHTYTFAGTYTVTVTVRDQAGLSSTATATVVATGNVIRNAGFEADLSGWNITGSGAGIALERVTGGHSGDFAALLRNTGTTTATCTLNDGPDWVRPTEAGTYTGSLWVRADTAGATLKLRFREYAGSALVGSSVTQVALTSSWQEVRTGYTIQSPGSTLDFNAYVTGAAPGTCFHADDAAIVRG